MNARERELNGEKCAYDRGTGNEPGSKGILPIIAASISSQTAKHSLERGRKCTHKDGKADGIFSGKLEQETRIAQDLTREERGQKAHGIFSSKENRSRPQKSLDRVLGT